MRSGTGRFSSRLVQLQVDLVFDARECCTGEYLYVLIQGAVHDLGMIQGAGFLEESHSLSEEEEL